MPLRSNKPSFTSLRIPFGHSSWMSSLHARTFIINAIFSAVSILKAAFVHPYHPCSFRRVFWPLVSPSKPVHLILEIVQSHLDVTSDDDVVAGSSRLENTIFDVGFASNGPSRSLHPAIFFLNCHFDGIFHLACPNIQVSVVEYRSQTILVIIFCHCGLNQTSLSSLQTNFRSLTSFWIGFR